MILKTLLLHNRVSMFKRVVSIFSTDLIFRVGLGIYIHNGHYKVTLSMTQHKRQYYIRPKILVKVRAVSRDKGKKKFYDIDINHIRNYRVATLNLFIG